MEQIEQNMQYPVEIEPKKDDGLSDLFEVPGDETFGDVKERVEVDVERDVIDGDLSDLTEVTNDDILGKPSKPKRPKYQIRPRRVYYPPQSGMSGMR